VATYTSIDTATTRPAPASGYAGSESFRQALRAFSTGVTVVTSSGDGEACGVTVNAFTSVSLNPQLILVCLSTASSVARVIERHGVFAVNVLSSDQEWIARRFASPSRPRGPASFDGVAHRLGSTRAPILAGAACWLDCRLDDLHLAGDHLIAIGEVLDFDDDPHREPLVFHAGRYRLVRDREGIRLPAPLSGLLPTCPERR